MMEVLYNMLPNRNFTKFVGVNILIIMRYDILKFAFSQTFSMQGTSCSFWTVKLTTYDKIMKSKMLLLSYTALNVTDNLSKF